MIRKLGLEELVPLNVSPEKVDQSIFYLFMRDKISVDTWSEYFCSNAQQKYYNNSHEFLKFIGNTFRGIFSNFEKKYSNN